MAIRLLITERTNGPGQRIMTLWLSRSCLLIGQMRDWESRGAGYRSREAGQKSPGLNKECLIQGQ